MGAIKEPLATLYEQDFHAWAIEQAAALERRDWSALDVPNLAEEIESMGKQQRAELRNRLAQLLAHLAKWQQQPAERAARGRSWQLTVIEQRLRIEEHIAANPSLKPYIAEGMRSAWRLARVMAARESELPLERFTEVCPFTWDDAMREGWLPD